MKRRVYPFACGEAKGDAPPLVYLQHTAAIVHQLLDVAKGKKLFAEYFVALECEVGYWYASLHYGLIDEGKFKLLGNHKHSTAAGFLREDAAKCIAEWKRIGRPVLSPRAMRRAYVRRLRLQAIMGGQEVDGERLKRRHALDCAEWLAQHLPDEESWHDRLYGYGRTRSVSTNRDLRDDADALRCPACQSHDRRLPCIVCALPLARAFDRGGPDRPRTDPYAGNGLRSRMERSLKRLQYPRFPEFQRLARKEESRWAEEVDGGRDGSCDQVAAPEDAHD